MSDYKSGGSGGIRPLYGVIIRDKCKHAPPATLQAYKTVAQDLLNDAAPTDPDVQELKDVIKELEAALAK
jgi:hypothetical protein